MHVHHPARVRLLPGLRVEQMPVVVFIGGRLLAGPYAGDGGLLGLMAAIYAEELQGSAAALVLLTAPLLALGIGWAGLRGQRLLRAPGTTDTVRAATATQVNRARPERSDR